MPSMLKALLGVAAINKVTKLIVVLHKKQTFLGVL